MALLGFSFYATGCNFAVGDAVGADAKEENSAKHDVLQSLHVPQSVSSYKYMHIDRRSFITWQNRVENSPPLIADVFLVILIDFVFQFVQFQGPICAEREERTEICMFGLRVYLSCCWIHIQCVP
jgi:hypothetical protein